MRTRLTATGRMMAVVSMSLLLVGMTLLLRTSADKPAALPSVATQHTAADPYHLKEMDAQEQLRLRKMLKPLPASQADRFDRDVWVMDIQHVISRWVPNGDEARKVARWVYVYGKRFKISPEVVLAVIAVESRFDRFAVSNAGARGLMQVMPFWKKELGSANDNLLDVETNVRYGCAILRTYMNRYGTLARALSAYNGSLGNTAYPARVFAQMKRFKASAQDLKANG